MALSKFDREVIKIMQKREGEENLDMTDEQYHKIVSSGMQYAAISLEVAVKEFAEAFTNTMEIYQDNINARIDHEIKNKENK